MYDKGISIIIPVFNVEKYLNEMIMSLYKQTFRDIEIIIINDGSTDNSKNIIDQYLMQHTNIKYIEQKNSGVSVARNNAINSIEKEYTLFLDSDDYLDKNMLQLMYNKAKSTDADVTICGFKKVYESSFEDYTFDVDEDLIYSANEVINMMLRLEVYGYLWNKMFKTEKLIKNGIYFEPNRLIQDWAPVFKQISLAEKIVFINKPLYYYRQRVNSNVHKKTLKKVDDYNSAVTNIVNYINDNNIIVDNNNYYFFIAQTQASQIIDCINANIKCDKKVYEKYKILDINILDVIFNIKIPIKAKLKLILYKLKVLHKLRFLICK